MGFLDNSGDTILDAVLTDTGRMRLAEGNFKIAKFALGDDEIDYSNYNKTHASGNAYYDLEILQTPILEAFTNNTSLMKSKLISYANKNHLYLPTLKLNTLQPDTNMHSDGLFVLTTDSITANEFSPSLGVGNGYEPSNNTLFCRVDQGLDTTDLSPNTVLDDDINETQYLIEMDSRLVSLVSKAGDQMSPLYVDDDEQAAYLVTTAGSMVYSNSVSDKDTPGQAIRGPRGSVVEFWLKASNAVTGGQYFGTIGGTTTMTYDSGSKSYKFIDTVVNLTGITTGATLSVNFRLIQAP
jgi:hypothetical protein